MVGEYLKYANATTLKSVQKELFHVERVIVGATAIFLTSVIF